jgi:hypothetical protein
MISRDAGNAIDFTADLRKAESLIRANCESAQNETVESDPHSSKQRVPRQVTPDGMTIPRSDAQCEKASSSIPTSFEPGAKVTVTRL